MRLPASLPGTQEIMRSSQSEEQQEDEELICLANFSEYGQNAWLNCLEGEYEDLFTGEKLEMNSVWMNPYQYRWCVKK